MQFNKPALKHNDLIALLQARGLPVGADEQVRLYKLFNTVGYYRLTGYMLPFQRKNPPNKHHFFPGTTLAQIVELYDFDTQLRQACGEALEQVEVAVRTSICDYLSRAVGAHWPMNAAPFKLGRHGRNLQALADAAEFDLTTNAPKRNQTGSYDFIASYYQRYTNPPMPASWMVRETTTFRTWAFIYEDLDAAHQKQISDQWRFPSGQRIDHALLVNWLHSVSVFRNRCAHHARITSRVFPFGPNAPTDTSVAMLFNTQKRSDLRTLLCVLAILLRSANPRSNWTRRLYNLFEAFPRVNISTAVGMPHGGGADWRQDPVWNF